jgi:type III pantothenate kinase
MILCLDIGNSHLFGGVFTGDNLVLRFRKATNTALSSDEIGVFLCAVLRENNLDPASVSGIALCSVVPKLTYSVRAACVKYFKSEPFLLQAGERTGLKIRYHNPHEVGADRIANAVAAVAAFPDRHLLIIDLGTATTLCAITADRQYLGGTILTGIGTAMEALASRAAKLSSVEIVVRPTALGRTTAESIQSGLFFGHIGAIRECKLRLIAECFAGRPALTIGTGGFASLLDGHALFDVIEPDLVLHGLRAARLLRAD